MPSKVLSAAKKQQIKDLRRQGMSIEGIAQVAGVSFGTARSYSAGIKPPLKESPIGDPKTDALHAKILQLEADKLESRQSLDGEKEYLRAKVATLGSQLKVFLKAEEKVKEHIAAVKLAVKALDPLPRYAYKPSKQSKVALELAVHVTDWHVGELIRQEETEGWGNYNWSIAQDRVLGQFLPDVLKWLDTQRSGYLIEKIKLICTGDFVSGDIHQELLVTNEFPLPVQTANAGDLLGHLGAELARHCAELTVVEIGADNHSRLVRKPQAKQKAQNSMSHLVYHIANKRMERLGNVKIELAEGMKLLFEIAGTPFLGEHGDTVKSWMGVPWYGIEREKAREATRRMFDNRGFKYLIMGHWHTPHFAQNIVGGCLSGTTEYDHSCGRLSRPAQTAFLVGKHGPFSFTPFFLN